MVVIATDTTCYQNMILETMSNDGETVQRYELSPGDGYVIHNHALCDLGDKELGFPAQCYYTRRVYMPRNTDLSAINDKYQAVLESAVSSDSIFGGDRVDNGEVT